jgi:hypothetical protein
MKRKRSKDRERERERESEREGEGGSERSGLLTRHRKVARLVSTTIPPTTSPRLHKQIYNFSLFFLLFPFFFSLWFFAVFIFFSFFYFDDNHSSLCELVGFYCICEYVG